MALPVYQALEVQVAERPLTSTVRHLMPETVSLVYHRPPSDTVLWEQLGNPALMVLTALTKKP